MESQTEQLDSNPQPQDQTQQPLPDQPDSQPEIQLDSDSQPLDLPDQSDNIVEGSDEPVIAEPASDSTPEVSAEPETPVEEAVPEPVTLEQEEVQPLTFADLNDVDSRMSDFTPEVRAHVSPILDLAKSAQTDYQIAAQKYETARTELVSFAESLRDYGVDAAPVIEKFQTQQEQISKLNDTVVSTTWSAFQVMHPEYEQEQPKLKKVFSELVSSMLERFPGDNTLQKLNGAYKYAKYTVGASSPAKPAPAPVAAPAPAAPAPAPTNVDSKAQSLVNDGTVSGSQSMVDVADLSWNEIMDRHKHLLE